MAIRKVALAAAAALTGTTMLAATATIPAGAQTPQPQPPVNIKHRPPGINDAPRSGTPESARWKALVRQRRQAYIQGRKKRLQSPSPTTTAAGPPAAGTVAPAALTAAGDPPVVVSLTFDDERVSQSVADSELNTYGFQGTFYIISQYMNDPAGDNPESLSFSQIQQLAADGNEIAGHTQTHPDLPTLTASQQQQEICGGRQDLIADGFAPPVSFAYPYGDYTQQTEQIVASCGFTSGRTVSDGPDTLPPFDPYATAAMDNVDNTTTVSQMEGWVQSAEANPSSGNWVQIVWHDIVTDPSQAEDEYYQLSPDFDAFLNWLSGEAGAGNVVVQTVGQAIASNP